MRFLRVKESPCGDCDDTKGDLILTPQRGRFVARQDTQRPRQNRESQRNISTPLTPTAALIYRRYPTKGVHLYPFTLKNLLQRWTRVLQQ